MQCLPYRAAQLRGRVELVSGQAHRFLHLQQLQQRGGALRARAQVDGHFLLLRRTQFAIGVQCDLLPVFTIHDFFPSTCTMCSRTCFLARASRDMTVPIGMPSASATSWYFISSMSARRSTSRKAGASW